jgi:addiction module RelE/StbE family toxin
MMQLKWRAMALRDRGAIMDTIAQGQPAAAIKLDIEFEEHAEQARQRPELYKPGRVADTREIVVRPHYVMVYRFDEVKVEILRVLHTAQKWPK